MEQIDTLTCIDSARTPRGVFERNAQIETYRRLAMMDLPALRSLIVELTRVSDESAAKAVQEGTTEAAERAQRNAQRAAAAQAALASAEVAG